jgi:hypothetical protein
MLKYAFRLSCELKLGKAFVVTDLSDEFSAVAIASYGPKNAGYCKLEELDQAKVSVFEEESSHSFILWRRGYMG